MSSRAEQKKQARRERMRREAEAAAAGKRRRFLVLIGAGGLVAAIAVAALILVSQSGSGGTKADGGSGLKNRVAREYAGIPQEGDVLGNPDAKVTLTEFGDLQCPACKVYAEQVAPRVIASYAKTGKVKLAFKNWLIIGPDSQPAAVAALAAGQQGKLWQFVEVFYASQGRENSGYVTEEFLTGIAKQVKGLDVARWKSDREKNGKAYGAELRKISAEASRRGFNSTPSFLIQQQGEAPEEFGGGSVPSYDDVKAALDKALQQAQ